MDMSKAALPPRHGPILPGDETHPRFGEYRRYRSGLAAQLVEAEGFRDWLHQRETQAAHDDIARHPRFREFQTWMRATKAGGRRCPAGDAFPANFMHWLDGGRW